MATGNITRSTEAAGIDEIFLDDVLRAREFNIVIQKQVDRSWEEGYKHGDVFHKRRIPNIETQYTHSDAQPFSRSKSQITLCLPRQNKGCHNRQ